MEQDKLISEAAQAKAAGLSYGKWKALQPNPEPAVIPEGWRACDYCGGLFVAHRNKKYCGSVCSGKAYRRDHPAKKQEYMMRALERRREKRLEEKRRQDDQNRTEKATT